MSFASDTKNEISRTLTQRTCCAAAETAGLIKGCGSVLLKGRGRLGLRLTTENPAVARHIKSLLTSAFGVRTDLRIVGSSFKKNRHLYEISITSEEGAMRVLKICGIATETAGNLGIATAFEKDIIKKKCCRRAALKGLFLGAGTMSDPESGYDFELVFSTKENAAAARRLIAGFEGLEPKVRKRKESYVVYLKPAEQIKDILNIIGAHTALLNFENVRVKKDMKARVSRLSNYDNANITRSLTAADAQIEKITKLKEENKLEFLPPKIREIAELRIKNPEATLTELGEQLTPPIKKAAVAARLKRL
jgi:DNA-binding protein WhiA